MNTLSSMSKLLAALQHMQALPARAPAHARMAAHHELARAYVDEGALASAEAHLERALAASLAVPSVDAQVDLLCDLGERTAQAAEQAERATQGAGRDARQRSRQHAAAAARLAAHVSDPAWEVTVLLRISDIFNRLGDHDDASALQTRALRLMSRRSNAPWGTPAALSAGRMR